MANVRQQLDRLHEQFLSADQFIADVVKASHVKGDVQSDQTARLKFLNKLLSKSRADLGPRTTVKFDRNSKSLGDVKAKKNAELPLSLFEIIQMIADGQLTIRDHVVEFPDWLERGLERLVATIEPEPVSPKRRDSPRRKDSSAQSSPKRREESSPQSPKRRSASPKRREESSLEEQSPKRREEYPYREQSPKRREESPYREQSPKRRSASPKRRESSPQRRESSEPSPSQFASEEAYESALQKRRSRTPSPKKSTAWAKNTKKYAKPDFYTLADRLEVGGKQEVGARVIELKPHQRLALHFMTPGDASRKTLIDFVDLVGKSGTTLPEPFNSDGDVSYIRNYAYDLWLSQTDEDLFALANDISGGTGTINQTIEQELDDAVRRYQQQLDDVKQNGQLVLKNMKVQADALKDGVQRDNFLQCWNEVRDLLEPDETKPVNCTQIKPDDLKTPKQVISQRPSKWLSRAVPDFEQNKFAFLKNMSARQLSDFGDYLVSQSALGACRFSNYLEDLQKTLESKFQSGKEGGPIPTIDELETLRFVEWIMRRPVATQITQESLMRWLLKFPYIQGPLSGEFIRDGQKRGEPIQLSSKYAKFAPKNANDQTLSALFKITNRGNQDIMEMATSGDQFRDAL